jgi:hypothetical protein
MTEKDENPIATLKHIEDLKEDIKEDIRIRYWCLVVLITVLYFSSVLETQEIPQKIQSQAQYHDRK